jgi:hypothetical protein
VAVYRKALFRDRNQTRKRTLFTCGTTTRCPPRCLPAAQSAQIHAKRLKLSNLGSLEPDNSDTFVSSTLTRSGSIWTDRGGNQRPLTIDDILIVAPYNNQVNRLTDRLPGAKVGTVDKFQGQEAAVVIYSMTASTPEDAPRGDGIPL